MVCVFFISGPSFVGFGSPGYHSTLLWTPTNVSEALLLILWIQRGLHLLWQ